MIRILLADDHEFVRRGVRSLLETQPDFQICGEAVDGRQAVAMAEQLRPDVIVLDISMPEMNGLDAARSIRKTAPDSEILILSQHNSNEVMKAAASAGARGYIAKSELARNLLAAVAIVSEHKTAFNPKPRLDGRESVSPVSPAVLLDGNHSDHVQNVVSYSRSDAAIAAIYVGDAQPSLGERAPMLIWAADVDGKCTSFNEQWLEFTGKTLEHEIATGWTERVHPDDAASCMQTYFSSIQAHRSFTTEFRLKRSDGEYRWLFNNAVPKLNAHGEIDGYIGCCIDITERKSSEDALRRSHDDLESLVEQRTAALRRLSARLLQIQDEERRRIARELHDSLGQLLTAARINIDLCLSSPNTSSDLLNEVKTLLDRCLTETRTLSHLLHPPLLDEAGLDSALHWYVEGFAKRSGIHVDLQVPPDLKRLPSSVEIATFRVLQESLTNVHRHSGSHSVEVRLRCSDELVTLEVQDHGKGFGPEILRSSQKTGFHVGVGLAGIRERVTELGGELSISSGQQGTLIRVFIPVASGAQASAGQDSDLARQTATTSS